MEVGATFTHRQLLRILRNAERLHAKGANGQVGALLRIAKRAVEEGQLTTPISVTAYARLLNTFTALWAEKEWHDFLLSLEREAAKSLVPRQLPPS